MAGAGLAAGGNSVAAARVGSPMRAIAWAVAAVFLMPCSGQAHADAAADARVLREGDIVFQTSRSAQSEAIQRATHSPFSHVGVVHRAGDAVFVYEAVGPVKLTPLDAWVGHGEGLHFVAKRLKNRDAVMTRAAVERAETVAREFRGRAYDAAFAWSDERLYCSELVYKIYDRGFGVKLGQVQKLREFDLSDPVVKAKLHERYGEHVPLDEPVISPASIAASDLLETVLER